MVRTIKKMCSCVHINIHYMAHIQATLHTQRDRWRIKTNISRYISMVSRKKHYPANTWPAIILRGNVNQAIRIPDLQNLETANSCSFKLLNSSVFFFYGGIRKMNAAQNRKRAQELTNRYLQEQWLHTQFCMCDMWN